MLNVSQTFNMPQTSMYKGFEACYVKWLNLFAIFLFKMGGRSHGRDSGRDDGRSSERPAIIFPFIYAGFRRLMVGMVGLIQNLFSPNTTAG